MYDVLTMLLLAHKNQDRSVEAQLIKFKISWFTFAKRRKEETTKPQCFCPSGSTPSRMLTFVWNGCSVVRSLPVQSMPDTPSISGALRPWQLDIHTLMHSFNCYHSMSKGAEYWLIFLLLLRTVWSRRFRIL